MKSKGEQEQAGNYQHNQESTRTDWQLLKTLSPYCPWPWWFGCPTEAETLHHGITHTYTPSAGIREAEGGARGGEVGAIWLLPPTHKVNQQTSSNTCELQNAYSFNSVLHNLCENLSGGSTPTRNIQKREFGEMHWAQPCWYNAKPPNKQQSII